jgi:lipoyl(octanoyl) transferase
MAREKIICRDMGQLDYQAAWTYQEQLLQENVQIKSAQFHQSGNNKSLPTRHYLLFVEHPAVYTERRTMYCSMIQSWRKEISSSFIPTGEEISLFMVPVR